jgi:HAD superfamily hydrolase (TIGR01509 family)
MRVKAVLFDLFDTLLLIDGGDAFYTPCLSMLHKFLVKNGIDVSFEDFERVYFEVRDALYAEFEKNLEEPHFNVRVSRTLQNLNYNCDVFSPIVLEGTRVFTDEFIRYVSLDNDTMDVLRKLRGKFKLGLVSNFAIPECVWELLRKFRLQGFFDVILISAEVNKRKPSPEIFEEALKALDVDPPRAVFVGDSLSSDVKGAKNIGIKAVLIERKPLGENSDVKPDTIIQKLKELLPVLENC